MSLGSREVTVIGSGIGGLCAAIRLAVQGFSVRVLEKNAQPGGRCGEIREQGYQFDIGPTILLVPSVLEALYRDAGRNLHDALRVRALTPNYRAHFPDGSSVLLTREREVLREQLERIEPGAFAQLDAFLKVGQAQMDAALSRFAVTHYPSLASFMSAGTVRDLVRARAYTSLARHVGNYFRDERLRTVFSFQTMYLGLSPYDAPALYGLLPYTELREGIYYTDGGLYSIPKALEALARELGVKFEYNTEVTRLVPTSGRISHIDLASGERRAVDLVLCNGDIPWVYEKLLPEGNLPRAQGMRYSSSGYMLYLGLNTRYEGIGHHNVFFAPKFRECFDEIFRDKVIPSEVSFYTAASCVTDPTTAPEGHTNLYVLVPAPHQSHRVEWQAAAPRLREIVLDRLEQTVAPGLRQHIVFERQIDPNGWASMFNLQHGSAFGLAHTLDQVGAMRPRNRDEQFGNLYFCGASTQPGTGIPLVALSAHLAVLRMVHDVSTPSRKQGYFVVPNDAVRGVEVHG